MSLLPFGLALKQALLLARLTFELLLEQAQAVLRLPELRPAIIEQRQAQSKHRIDMLGSPMHAWPCRDALASRACDCFPRCQTRSASPAEGRVG